MIVTIDHARAAGFCAIAVRRWCEAHGIDFKEFLVNGLDEARIEEIGDAAGLEALRVARDGR